MFEIIYLLFYSAVLVNDYKFIKELFNDNASTGRLGDNPVMMEFTKGPYGKLNSMIFIMSKFILNCALECTDLSRKGILNSSGPTWEAQRKFTMRILRSFGFAKTSMETMILDEVQIMLDWFRNQEGSPILCTRIFTAPIINSLWRIISGDRCQWEKCRPAIVDATDDFFRLKHLCSVNLFLDFLIT